MKAMVLHGVGQVLKLQDVDVPELDLGEALVRVHAAALNRRDWWIQRGQYAGLKFPIVLGSDGAGVVVSVHSSVERDQAWVGQEVVLLPSLDWAHDSDYQPSNFKIVGLPTDGTLAEYVKVPIGNLYPKPAHLNWAQAAAIPLAGLTAFRALFRKAKLQAKDRVLISGIGGGVATFGLQWATSLGCEVFVTSSSQEKIDSAILKGAHGGVLYTNPDWSTQLKELAGGFDVVLDGALGPGFAEFLDLCNPGGRIVFYGGTHGDIPALNGRKIFWKQLQLLGTTMGSAVDFESMLKWVNQHEIYPIIEQVLPIEKAQEGLQMMTSSSQFGKIVISINV